MSAKQWRMSPARNVCAISGGQPLSRCWLRASATSRIVNDRPVRDPLLHGAVRGAYQDFLARDRHPMVALFLEMEPREVDVIDGG